MIRAQGKITRKSSNFVSVGIHQLYTSAYRRQWKLLFLLFFLADCAGPSHDASKEKAGQEAAAKVEKKPKRRIVFFGDSLSAGYGLERPEDAFPARIAAKIDSLGWDYEVVNAGLSGETSAGGDGRIDWILREPVDVFVLELGANDGLRGIPVAETRKNLQSIINKVRKANPDVRLVMAGMQAPPNMGRAFTDSFRNVFPELARKNKMAIIPFLLEGVAGEPSLNQQDGIHPTAEGHRMVAEHVWETLHAEIKPDGAAR